MSLTKVSYSMIESAPANVLDFGAVGDGVANDTAAIQAAINSFTNGGTVLFPEGIYLINAALNLSNKVNIALIGSSPVNTLQASGSQIRWASGVGTGPIVNLTGAFSVEIGNLGFYVTNDAFNGNIIQIAPGIIDASGIHIHDCAFVGDTAASQIAKSISLSGVLDSVFERCMFRYGFQAIGCSGVSNNAITIRNCWFDEAITASIGMNGATGWVVQNNVFEVVATSAILNTGSMSAVNIIGNWMGDAISPVTTIDLISGTTTGCNIDGNYMEGVLGGTLIKLSSITNGSNNVNIRGNRFATGGTAIDLQYGHGCIVEGNYIKATTPYTAIEPTQCRFENNRLDSTPSGSMTNVGIPIANNANRALSTPDDAGTAPGMYGTGIYEIFCVSTAGAFYGCATYSFNGASINVTKLNESAANLFTANAVGTASRVNVYYDAGTTTYRIENNSGNNLLFIANARTIY